MTVAADLVLITIDPATGRSLLGSPESDPAVGGAVLVDLVLAERCAIVGGQEGARAPARPAPGRVGAARPGAGAGAAAQAAVTAASSAVTAAVTAVVATSAAGAGGGADGGA